VKYPGIRHPSKPMNPGHWYASNGELHSHMIAMAQRIALHRSSSDVVHYHAYSVTECNDKCIRVLRRYHDR